MNVIEGYLAGRRAVAIAIVVVLAVIWGEDMIDGFYDGLVGNPPRTATSD